MSSRSVPSEHNNSQNLNQPSSPKFYPKPAHFESKNQVAPNSLIFHRTLSDGAIRFLLALNGIATSGGNWVPIQSDLEKRLGWGEKKMRSIIKELKESGYLIVRQSQREKGEIIEGKKVGGQFLHNDFEYDLDGGYSKKELTQPQDKPSHNEYEPSAHKGSAVEGSSFEEGLPCSLEQPCLKEQQTEQGALPPEPPSLPAAVRCSLKEKLLEPFGFDDKTLDDLCEYPIERIENAIAALSQSKERVDIPNPKGWLRIAILKGFEPNATKESIEKEKEAAEAKEKIASDDRKAQANALFSLHKENFTKEFLFQPNADMIQLKIKDRFAILYYRDVDCIENLKKFIAQYLRTKC